MITWLLDRYGALVGLRLRSVTGRSNPRTRTVTAHGYAIRAYQTLQPNTRAWLSGQRNLFPTAVLVQTVNRCNARCSMCPYPYTVGTEPCEAMTDDLWAKIARECATEPGFALLVPTSKNEPLVDPKLADRIALFRSQAQLHQTVELVTNGVMLDAAQLDRLAEAGTDLITISVNAVDEQTFKATNAGLSWGRLMANLGSFSDRAREQVNLFVRFVRTRDNPGQERAFRRHWRSRGFNVFAFEVNNRAGAVRGYAQLLRPATLAHRVRQQFRRLLSRAIFPVCPYAFSIANIMQNGNMVLCANDWHNREVLGNVRTQTIRDAFNSPRAQEIRELMRQGRYDEIAPCRECSLWKESNWL